MQSLLHQRAERVNHQRRNILP